MRSWLERSFQVNIVVWFLITGLCAVSIWVQKGTGAIWGTKWVVPFGLCWTGLLIFHLSIIQFRENDSVMRKALNIVTLWIAAGMLVFMAINLHREPDVLVLFR